MDLTEVGITLFQITKVNSIFFAIIFLFKKENRKANRLLSFLFFMVAIDGIQGNISFYENDVFLGQYRKYYFSGILGVGPAFYFYIRKHIRPDFTLGLTHYIQFIPFILWNLYCMYRILTYNYIIQTVEDLDQLNHTYFILLMFSANVGRIAASIYIYLAIRQMNNHERWLTQNYSDIQGRTLSQLKLSTYLLIAILILSTLSASMGIWIKVLGQNEAFFPFYVAGYIIYMWIGITAYSIEQTEISEQINWLRKDSEPTNDEQQQIDRLIKLISSEKLYLNPNLKLSDLAEPLGTTTRKLSQLINSRLNKNFYELINNYRIEEAKIKLLDPDYTLFSIDAVALDSGFKTMSVFYDVFKKITGRTPKQYQKEHLSK